MADALAEVRAAVNRGSGCYTATELQRLQLVAALAAADEARETNRLLSTIATGIETSNLLAYAAMSHGERTMIPDQIPAELRARIEGNLAAGSR